MPRDEGFSTRAIRAAGNAMIDALDFEQALAAARAAAAVPAGV